MPTPTPKESKKKCSGAHCRCMDIGGQCQNMHWYHCEEHNPDYYPKGGTRPVPKCNAEANGVKCRPPCELCYGGRQITASSMTHTKEELKEEIIIRQILLDIMNIITDRFDEMETLDPDQSIEKWRGYKAIRNTIRDEIKTIAKAKGVDLYNNVSK